MRRTVWKFKPEVAPEKVGVGWISVPAGTVFLSAGMQGGYPVIYGIVDPAVEERVEYHVSILGTGVEEDRALEEDQYLGSLDYLHMVFHVFVRPVV